MKQIVNSSIPRAIGAFSSGEDRSECKTVPRITLAVAGLFLLGCSPGGVVAGTIGAAGTVAGAAVDVVLRSDFEQGSIE